MEIHSNVEVFSKLYFVRDEEGNELRLINRPDSDVPYMEVEVRPGAEVTQTTGVLYPPAIGTGWRVLGWTEWTGYSGEKMKLTLWARPFSAGNEKTGRWLSPRRRRRPEVKG